MITNVQVSLALLGALIYSAPISSDLDFTSTYQQFFRIKELIDKININRFKDHLEAKKKSTEAIPEAAVEPEVEEDDLIEIDLTEEAIENDQVTKTADIYVEDKLDEVVAFEEDEEFTTAAVETTEVNIVEETYEDIPSRGVFEVVNLRTEPRTEASITCLNNYCLKEATVASIETEDDITTQADAIEAPVTEAAATKRVPEDEELLNDIDTGSDTVYKYGYKILLKKVGGHIVPVGKIKFTRPTLIGVDPFSQHHHFHLPPPTTGQTDEATTTAAVVTTTETVIDEEEEAQTEVIEEETTTSVDVGEPVTVEVAEDEFTVIPVSLPDPVLRIVSQIQIIESLDEDTIEEGVMKMRGDAELAVESLKNLSHISSVSLSSSCPTDLLDMERMLADLAISITESTPIIQVNEEEKEIF